MGIILGILIFVLLVIFHELGHFFASRITKVKVLEFGVGLPPKLINAYTDKLGTIFSLNRIPLGGFVRLKGESVNEDDYDDKDSFQRASYRSKFIIILGGVTVNFIIAYFIFFAGFLIGIKPIFVLPDNFSQNNSESLIFPTYETLKKNGFVQDQESKPANIIDVISGGIAYNAGLKKGDVIFKINGENITSNNINLKLKENIGKTVIMDIINGGKINQKSITCPDENCIIGIQIDNSQGEIKTIKFGIYQSSIQAFKEIKAQTKLTMSSLWTLGKNMLSFNKSKITDSLGKLSGPVGAVKIGESIFSQNGLLQLIMFGGVISLALAIFNVLPIPALDGGRLLFVTIQTVFRIPEKKFGIVEGYINGIIFLILLLLGVYVIFQDLINIRGVGR